MRLDFKAPCFSEGVILSTLDDVASKQEKLLLMNPSGKGTLDWGLADFESSESPLGGHVALKPLCMVIGYAFTVYVSLYNNPSYSRILIGSRL